VVRVDPVVEVHQGLLEGRQGRQEGLGLLPVVRKGESVPRALALLPGCCLPVVLAPWLWFLVLQWDRKRSHRKSCSRRRVPEEEL